MQRPLDTPLRVLECRVYRGPSTYAYRKVIRLKLDLGILEHFPTSAVPGFAERLVERIPSLAEHTCSYGEPGGFVRRLYEGTWIGHVAEHVAIELQQLAGIKVSYGKTRSTGDGEGIYYVVYAYGEERVGIRAGWLALRLIQELLPPELRGFERLDTLCPDEAVDEQFNFQRALIDLIRLASDLALGPTSQSIVDAAAARGIPAMRLDEQSLVQLGYGKYQQRIRASVTGKTSNLAVEIASDKELTNRLLHDVGLPVPRNVLVYSEEEAVEAAETIGFPVVTKPLDVSHGRGVSLNLHTADEVRWGFAQAAVHRKSVLVEQFVAGRDFRVLIVNDQVVAAAERVPAHVIGDGKHTIGELIEITNQDPRRGFDHEKVLTRIRVDAQAERLLARARYTVETVLPPGERFFLRSTANISTGGTVVAQFRLRSVLQVNPERGAVECAFDVVQRERVPAEKKIDVAPANQFFQVRDGAGMHHRGAGHDQDPAAFLFRPLKLARHLADDPALGRLQRNIGRHELEDVGMRSRTLHRHDPNPLVTDHDLHPAPDFVKFSGGRVARLAIDDDRAIHQGRAHLDLGPIDRDKRLLVRRDVKVLRENAVSRGGGNLHILLLKHLRPVL